MPNGTTRTVLAAACIALTGCGGSTGSTGVSNNGRWIKAATPTVAPCKRCDHVMIYDRKRETVLLYGGVSSAGLLTDTWEWDGVAWREIQTTKRPEPSLSVAIATHEASGRILLCNDGGTWEWCDGEWRYLSSCPGYCEDFAMAYDPQSEKIILFGGSTGTGDERTYMDDTWQWDRARWQVLATYTKPAPRDRHAMFSAPWDEKLILCGGLNAEGWGGSLVGHALDDMWAFTGTRWEKEPSLRLPTVLMQFATASDTDRGHLVLFGGKGRGTLGLPSNFGGTFECNGHIWWQIETSDSPSPRRRTAMAYDCRRKKVVLFGGLGQSLLGDTWEYQPTAKHGG